MPDQLAASEVAALRRLLDHQAIVDCITRYARGVDRADDALVRSAYHPDAVEDHGAYIGGVDGLVAFLGAAHAPFPGYQRYVTNHSIDIAADRSEAHAESYYLCVLRKEGSGLLANGGRYIDRLSRPGGEWRIARRVVVMEWEGKIDGGSPRYPVTVPGAPAPSDVSYERPLDVTRESRSPTF
jgi:hypothetical protein